MNYSYIEQCNLSCGTGVRVVLWVCGCPIQCEGCQNEWLQNPNEGKEFDNEAFKELVDKLSQDYVTGLTFCGGSPLAPYNRDVVTELAKEIKERFPEKDIWCYTGFTWELLKDLEIMKYIDVLVDGKFVESLKDKTCAYRGSTNQRIILVQDSLQSGTIVLHPDN